MEGLQYKYKAFISYSHKDTYWAKWLKYRLDTFSSKRLSKEKHPLREAFLDQYNLSVNDLKEKGLPENLQHSKYLICLCTKHYNSAWVELEIAEFKRICANRGVDWREYIIPICINGNADIIPESLKGIKAINIDGILSFFQQEYAISLIVAKILDIDNPNEIYNYLRKIYLCKMSFLCLAIAVLATIGVGTWEFNRTRIVYYSDYVEGQYVEGQQSEWLKGIGEIHASAVDTLRECFRFEYKRIPLGEPQAGRWQLLRVVHQNVFSNPTEFEEQTTPFVRYPIMSIKYLYRDSMYMPERVECYNEYGNLQRIKQISGEKLDKIDFKNFKTELSFNRQTLSEFKDPLLDMLGNKYCNITHFDLERDKSGNVNRIVFKASNEKNALPMTDTRKHIAMALVRDSLGRITYVGYYTYMRTIDYLIGYNYTNYELNEKTLWNREKQKVVQDIQFKHEYPVVYKYVFTASDSSLIRCEYHLSKGVLQQKRTEKVFGYEQGKSLIINKTQLIDNVRYDYTKNGYVGCESHLDRDNNVSYYKLIKYNEDNRVACVEYAIPSENGNKRSAIGPEGYSYAEFRYEGGLLILQHLHGGEGGYNVKYSYDKDKQLVSIAYYDKSWKLSNLGDFNKTIASDNYERQVLDAINGLIDIKRAGNNDMFKGDTIYSLNWAFPFWCTYAKRVFDYDDWGNITKIRYCNDREECYIIINEDILEDGTVPSSIGYIINKKGHKFPLASSFRAKRSEKYEFSFLDPISSMLIENMFIDTEDIEGK